MMKEIGSDHMVLKGEQGESPRLLMRRREAADCLGMSLDSFEKHVQPHLRLVRRGQLVRVPVSEVRRWVRREMVTS